MVEAVAMRTTGLGGDSEVRVGEGLGAGLILGPRRLVPVSLLAADHPALVHEALDRALAAEVTGEHDGRFAIPMDLPDPGTEAPREAAVIDRLRAGPQRLSTVIRTRLEEAALLKLVTRGQVMVAGVTPSDAAHVLGRLDAWDGAAARKALTLMARRRDASGERIAPEGAVLAQRIIDQLTRQTVTCLLEAAFAEDGRDWGEATPEALARHPLAAAGLDRHQGVVQARLSLGVPVIGLGASAPSYYGAVGDRLGTRMVLPAHAGVANAIGAVVGQVAMHAEGIVTSPGPGRFLAHLPEGPQAFAEEGAALAALEARLSEEAGTRARAAGVEAARITAERSLRDAEVEGQRVFVEGRIRVTATGRPRIARA
jgi:N-methylhydantoinase A/oxoprolinase/acetone carboxylase beta subunit